MSFANDLLSFERRTQERFAAFKFQLLVTLTDRLVIRSPVGDPRFWVRKPPPGYKGGRFRGNWRYSFGAVNYSTTLAIDPSGAKTRERVRIMLADAIPNGVHYITNSLPYAIRLEHGWSWRQAPHGIVTLTAIEFEGMVRTIVGGLA